MRCAFYCTASSYRIDELLKFLHLQGFEPKIYDQAIHIKSLNHDEDDKDVYYFSYGCVVFWGFEEVEELVFLEDLKQFEINSLDKRIIDTSKYLYTDEEKTYINEEDDEIALASKDILIKLSLSYGLSQSVKMTHFENSVYNTIEKTRNLPEELRIKGTTSLSKKSMAQMIGALFAERNSINLHSDILDTPEFFWRRPRYETYYNMAASYLDINTRLEILNKKLDVIHELYQILSTEMNHIHSSRLEITIILLIVFEVVIIILKDLLHWLS
jgi:uncharacterized Rmd1/YagE family protein